MLQTVPNSPGNAYDRVPYPKFPHRHAHPRHLETLACLLGMTPPSIRSCRVLELGCAAGANLIPQAIDLPESHFLGIDLSQSQILDGQRSVTALGLKNLELRQANILEIDETWGTFDYILCHGVYSWVPPVVQGKILDVAQRNLTPNGVAVVSYNAYPGWHLKGMIRDLMLYHTRQFSEPKEQIQQSMAFLEFLAGMSNDSGALGQILREELETLRKSTDEGYLFHEYLEDYNQPFYFHQFIQEANARGLQYLAESEFDKMLLQNFPAKVQECLKGLPLIQQEQYMDFLRGRKFRSTLLCHQGIPLNRQVLASRMKQYHFTLTGDLQVSQVDIRSDAPATFCMKNASIEIKHPLVKVALMYLKEVFPVHVSFERLYEVALTRLKRVRAIAADAPEASAEVLASALLTGYTVAMLDLCVTPPRCVHGIPSRPLANPLARLQAASGTLVTNQRHQMIRLDEFQRQVIHRLDGQHDRSALVAGVQAAIESGELVVQHHQQPVRRLDPATLGSLVDSALNQLSHSSLLLA